jgi:hypothetical protein
MTFLAGVIAIFLRLKLAGTDFNRGALPGN